MRYETSDLGFSTALSGAVNTAQRNGDAHRMNQGNPHQKEAP